MLSEKRITQIALATVKAERERQEQMNQLRKKTSTDVKTEKVEKKE